MQQVIAVSLCATHAFSKQVRPAIRLLKGLGVEGDAHHGVTVKHRSRVRQDPTQPNLRQVHLIHEELHDELRASGFAIGPGTMGESITTRGVDLLCLPTGTRLRLGESALVELTGLRNPCSQLDNYQPGLTAAVLGRDEQGNLIRKAGVMAIVLEDGEVRPGDAIDIQLPPPCRTGPWRRSEAIRRDSGRTLREGLRSNVGKHRSTTRSHSMYKQSLAALFVMATLAGCASTKVQNPVNYITFRNEPLVKDVEKGMSQQEVLRIGGTPSGTQKRLMKPGSCNSYILNKDGQQQPFYVSFDGSGKVDGSGFLSCSELDRHERDARP